MEFWSRLTPLLLIGGVAAVLWWWSRKQSGATGGGLNVIRRAALLRGATLALIEVGGRHFLVGATEHSVDLLAELDEDFLIGMDVDDSQTEPWTDLFARAKSLVRRDDPGPGFDETIRY